MTDREQLLAWKEERQAAATVAQHLEQQELAGAALAHFCAAFLQAMAQMAEAQAVETSRDEALWLLGQALQGR